MVVKYLADLRITVSLPESTTLMRRTLALLIYQTKLNSRFFLSPSVHIYLLPAKGSKF